MGKAIFESTFLANKANQSNGLISSKTIKMKTRIIILISILFFAHAIVFGQQKENIATVPTENSFKQAQREHLALTQYYRWFQVFERDLNDARIKNHFDILSDSIILTMADGSSQGKEHMLGFMNYVSSWQNAHHIKETWVKANTDGSTSLEADILYQNILPDGKQNAYKIHYTTRLQEIKSELPIFTDIKLIVTETIENPVFEDAYIENRSKSFLHYWLYLMGDLNGNEAKFKELLAPEFSFDLLREESARQEQMKAILHSFKNFQFTLNSDQTISVSVDIERKGININDEKLSGEVHHEWILENDPDDRFARMKVMKTTHTKPFQVVQDF